MGTTPANALNITAAGIQIFDGTATLTATTTTQYNTLVGNTGNTIANVSTGTSGQVLTSNGNAANPSYQSLPFTKLPWTDKNISFAAASENGYFVTATATATLPGSPSQGDMIAFAVDVDPGTGLLTIQANTGQYIRIGKAISLAASTVINNFQGDSLVLIYRASDTTWIADDVLGTWTVTTS